MKKLNSQEKRTSERHKEFERMIGISEGMQLEHLFLPLHV